LTPTVARALITASALRGIEKQWLQVKAEVGWKFPRNRLICRWH
jgi:hypothetical protein